MTFCQIPVVAEEQTRECREQEYKDHFGNCKPCKQCDAGQELSKVGTPLFWIYSVFLKKHQLNKSTDLYSEERTSLFSFLEPLKGKIIVICLAKVKQLNLLKLLRNL